MNTERTVHGSGYCRSKRKILIVGLIFLGLSAMPCMVSAQEFTWESYAEAGGGISLAGGSVLPVMTLEAGFLIGSLELGTSLVILPLEFGNPDLVTAAAVHYGTSVGICLGDEGSIRPLARFSVGGIARDRAEGTSHLDGYDAEKYFSASISLGADIPVGERWSVRPWFAWRLAPDANDYEGGALGGPDFGIAVRTTWITTVR
ncbi:MAG: hypothetical protein A2Y38_01800 [Spirochaetes bacterium GWB1_59_5]|nr:MAG: hypothetical protein A2Y38_01800 [Spirochaetes bacterium GWB1_59_5]